MRVFYVCTGNSFRSPVAEALTRKHHPSFEVESAGTDPASRVASNGKALLEEATAGEFVKPSPDGITQRAIDQADLVIAMEENHLEHLEENYSLENKQVLVWEVEDPINPEVEPEAAFEEIEKRVRALIP